MKINMDNVDISMKNEIRYLMDNVYQYKTNDFLWIGITTFHEKLITQYINNFCLN